MLRKTDEARTAEQQFGGRHRVNGVTGHQSTAAGAHVALLARGQFRGPKG